MSKVLIIADMEGCIGVYDMSNYNASKELMVKEVDNVINYFLNKKHFEISFVDEHDSGYNVWKLRNTYPNVEFYQHLWNLKDVETIDFAVLIGYHGKNGANGRFCHTLRPEISVLKLGKKEIGEIEFITNFLAFYGVPVFCVTGDEGAREEVESLGISFYATKSISDNEVVERDAYNKQINAIDEALLQPQMKYKYDDSAVEVVFKNNSIQDYLPERIFNTSDQGVIFNDTLHLNEDLYGLCMYLNAAHEYRSNQIRLIAKHIKEKYSQDELKKTDDPILKRLFFEKDPLSISNSEFKYIISAAKKKFQPNN
jgi:D-aminopeptidase